MAGGAEGRVFIWDLGRERVADRSRFGGEAEVSEAGLHGQNGKSVENWRNVWSRDSKGYFVGGYVHLLGCILVFRAIEEAVMGHERNCSTDSLIPMANPGFTSLEERASDCGCACCSSVTAPTPLQITERCINHCVSPETSSAMAPLSWRWHPRII
jgi:hypothetical protein